MSPTAALDPMRRVMETLERAARNAPFDHTAAALATASAGAIPSIRTVLVRGADETGFTFFTNYESGKGQDLAANPVAALCFYWPWLDEQVLAQGRASRLDAAASDAYFASRPRGSQIGAWASRQSAPLGSRAELEARYRELEQRYDGREIPRPPHWGGFRIEPDRIEFWKAGRYRLHDREVYTRRGRDWTVARLNP
jgi:pyridoxamine 5'-phosphate oxidase